MPKWYTSSLSVPLPFLPNITRVCIRFRCMWFVHLNANLIPGLSECRFSWAQKRQHAAFFPGMYVNLCAVWFLLLATTTTSFSLTLYPWCSTCVLQVFCVSNLNIISFHLSCRGSNGVFYSEHCPMYWARADL
jgi:hypothetical protein